VHVNAIERFRSLVSELQPGVLRVCSAEGPLEGFAGAEATDRFKMASIRKLIVALLFGLMEERGLVHRSTRLRRFGLSDIRPMEDFSLEATMLQLLGCMSGVRHPAVGDPETDGDARSEQPSQTPGTSWRYSNWDFNVLSMILDRCYPGGIAAAYQDLLATPLGLSASIDVVKCYAAPHISLFPAQQFHLRMEELERIGLMLAQGGLFSGRRIISKAWIDECSMPRSPTGAAGLQALYGLGCYAARDGSALLSWGFGGQILLVLPATQRVMVSLMYTHRAAARRLAAAEVAALAEAAWLAFG